jgi:RND family efflux transporter MFP subunit
MMINSVIHLFIAGLMTICIFAAGCGQDEVVVEEAIIRPVKTIVVVSVRDGLERTFSGTVHAGQEASLAFRVGGKVEEILVDVGDKVEKDQVLARLDTHNYELSVKNTESNLASARASYKNSESNYQRQKRLYENSNISKSQLDQYETQRHSDLSQMDALAAQLDQARNQLAYTSLKAPFNGYVSTKNFDEFENVVSGQSVFSLVDPGELKVNLGIPESLITRIRGGEAVSVKLESIPDTNLGGVVSEVGVAIDSSTGTYPVTVQISNPSPDILPGMAAEVTFTFGFAGGTGLIVPTSALLEDIQTGERYLWIFSDGTVKKRQVKTGALVTEGIEIITGLEEGETVVTAGVHRIEEGQRVRILE